MKRLAFFFVLFAPLPACAADGRAVFETHCSNCHSVEAAQQPMQGPMLAKLNGRRMGSSNGFDYSPAFEKMNRDGVVWNAEKLRAFIREPNEAIPGTFMAAPKRMSEDEGESLISFLLR